MTDSGIKKLSFDRVGSGYKFEFHGVLPEVKSLNITELLDEEELELEVKDLPDQKVMLKVKANANAKAMRLIINELAREN